MGPRSSARAASPGWSPDQLMRLLALGTCSLCMLGLVGVILVAVLNGTISASILGDYKTGGGLIGILVVLYSVMRRALK